jgi:hypothetical protein
MISGEALQPGFWKCIVCKRKVRLSEYFEHVKARHPKTAAGSTLTQIVVDKEEAHTWAEIARLAREIHKFRFGVDGKLDKAKLKGYEREIRARLEKGETVPGFTKF